MALLDRLRPQPAWKHADPAIRLTAVEGLTAADQATLAIIARDDEAPRVRRAAVLKVEDLDTLLHVAAADRDETVKQEAQARLLAIALESEDAARARRAAAGLSDARSLSAIARGAADAAVALAAQERLTETTALAGVARQSAHEAVRLAALARLNDPADLEAVATRSDHKDVGLAALERLAPAARAETLEGIAIRARNKVVGRRAKAIVKERAAIEAEVRAAAEALARRRGQLLEALESLAAARDKARIRSQQAHLGQQWRDLPAPPADLAERWERSMERASMQYDELSRQEALEAEQRAAREAAETQRRQLIAAAAAVTDDEAADRLAALRAEYAALAPVEGLDTAGLDREFAAAAASVESRVAHRARIAAAQARLTELAAEAAAIAELPDLEAARPRWQAMSKEWRDLTGGVSADGPFAETHAAAVARWKAREQDAREAQARQAAEQDAQAQQVLERAAAVAANAEAPIKDLDHAVKELRAAIEKASALSPAGRETLLPKLKALADEIQPRVREMREADDWRRWANAGIQDELCKRIEALKEVTDLAEAARQLRDLRRQWKAVAAAPREGSDALWLRFKAAADEIQAKVDAHFSAVAAEHAENLAKKLALCEQAEALAQSTDWIATADTLKRLQAEWQAVGAVPKEQAAEVARRFRTACDTFFTRRKTDLAHRKEEWSDNQKKKEALCARMEEIADSTDWNNTFNEIKKLQAEWKAVGPVRRNKSEALWKRFRGACDRFFERYGKRHEIDLHKRIEEREAVCRELEALAPRYGTVTQAAPAEAPTADTAADSEAAPPAEGAPIANDAEAAALAAQPTPTPTVDPSTVAAAVEDVWKRWRQLPGVPPEAFTPLRARFESALTTVVTSYPEQFKHSAFDLDATRQRMQSLCDEVEGLTKSSGATPQAGGSSVTALAMLLKESLAANTIGGRVNEEAKARAAFERVRRAQSAWRDLGPAIGSEAHALESRFHRACRRFFEQHPQFEQAARGGGRPGHRGHGGHGGHGGERGDRGDRGERGPRGPRPSQPPRQ